MSHSPAFDKSSGTRTLGATPCRPQSPICIPFSIRSLCSVEHPLHLQNFRLLRPAQYPLTYCSEERYQTHIERGRPAAIRPPGV